MLKHLIFSVGKKTDSENGTHMGNTFDNII